MERSLQGRLSALEEFAIRSRAVAWRGAVDAETVRVLDALDQAGVDVRLLKGAAIAQTLYRADEARGYVDVDLLIAADRLPLVGATLTRLGYTNINELLGLDDVGDILHAEVFSGVVAVDVHWRLQGCAAPPALVWETLRARRAFIQLGGRAVPILDQVGLAFHLALHAAQHGPDDRQTMGDLRRGVERWSRETWREAARLAVKLEATDAFAAGLGLVPAGAMLAHELQLPPAERLLWEIAHRDSRPRGTFHLEALARAHGAGARVNVLRRSLFPRRAWIAWEYRWARGHPVPLPVGYLLHIARAPLWALRAVRYRRARPRS